MTDSGSEDRHAGKRGVRGPNTLPYGRYKLLLPTLRHLVVDHGVSVRTVSDVFGLKQKTVTGRLSDIEAFEDREARDIALARHALAEEIKRGNLDFDEFRDNLGPGWEEEVLEALGRQS